MRKLATAAFSYAAAVALAVYLLPLGYLLYIAVCLAVLSCVCFAVKNDLSKRLAIVCISAALGLSWAKGYDDLFRAPARALDGKTLRIAATIDDYGEVLDYGTRAEALLAYEGRTYRTVVFFSDRSLDLVPGDVVSVEARLASADTFWGEASLYYAANGIVLKAYCSQAPNVYRPDATPVRYYPRLAAHLVSGELDRLYNDFGSAFMRALVTGDTGGFTDAFALEINKTGLQHVFAVSGLHLAFLLSVISLLVKRRRLRAAIGLPVLIFFTAMVGAPPSALRSVIMYGLVLAAPLLRRESDGITTLSLALLAALVINPWSVAHLGLQLTFAASASLTLFAPAIYRWLAERKPALWVKNKLPLPKRWRGAATAFVLSCLSSSIGVLVLATPILALNFHYVCVTSPLSNLLTLWAFDLSFILGLIASALGLLFSPLGAAAAFIAKPLMAYIAWVVGLLSKIPFATVSSDYLPYRLWLMLVYGILILSVVFKNRRPYVQLACCALAFGAAYLATSLYIGGSGLIFTALDVGQGQCLVASSRGETVVVDCGGTKSPDQALYTYLTGIGADGIDMLIVTHYHDDHAAEVPGVIETIKVDRVVMPDVPDETGTKNAIAAAAKARGTEVVLLDDDALADFGVCSMRIFGPLGGSDENERCLSMVISRQDYDILITADMSADMEGLLAATRDLPDAEVLVAGHHGSKTSTGDRLLSAVTPETAVISVGVNSYGHPSEQTISRLEAAGAVILRTDLLGNVTIRK